MHFWRTGKGETRPEDQGKGKGKGKGSVMTYEWIEWAQQVGCAWEWLVEQVTGVDFSKGGRRNG